MSHTGISILSTVFMCIEILPLTYTVAALKAYIFSDLRNHVDLAFSWLYQEYASCMNMVSTSPDGNKQNMASYDECLTIILDGLMNVADQKEAYVSRSLKTK